MGSIETTKVIFNDLAIPVRDLYFQYMKQLKDEWRDSDKCDLMPFESWTRETYSIDMIYNTNFYTIKGMSCPKGTATWIALNLTN